MGRISKFATATALSAAALGANAPTALGDPISSPPQLSPRSDAATSGAQSCPVEEFQGTPTHFTPIYHSSIPKPKLLMMEKSARVNSTITFTPMERSPLGHIPLLPASVKLSPHGSIHSWSVSPQGIITFTPKENFQGEAKASYSVEDAAGTIFTSSISVQVG